MYIEQNVLFVFLVPIWVIFRTILFILNKKRKRDFSLKREAVLSLFFIYILCFIGVTLFPLNIMFRRNRNWTSVNVIPVIGTVKEVLNITNDPNMSVFFIKFWIKNIMGNMLLLFPLGIMMPLLWNRFNSMIRVTFFAFAISLSVETLQLLSGYIGNIGRAFDIDDIILNTLGAFIGFIVYKEVLKSVNKNLYNKDKDLVL